MSKVDFETKILKLMERREKLEERRDKINDQIRDISNKIKDLEKQQEERNIQNTIITLKDKGISINDIAKAVKSGELDFLKDKIESQ